MHVQAAGFATTLQPGLNRLIFRVSVLKQGLYVLKHVHARLGRLSLLLRSALPDEAGLPPDVLTSSPLPALSELQPQPVAIGAVDPRGTRSYQRHVGLSARFWMATGTVNS